MPPINVKDNVKIEFEESELTKRQVECKIIDYDREKIVLNYSRVSPYYYQFLHEGKEIKMYYYSEGGIYIFESIVINSPAEGSFEIEMPPDYTKIQRRDFIRAYTELDIQIVDGLRGIVCTSKTIDIGGNGIRFKSSEKLEFGKVYDVYMYLSEDEILKVTGAIIKIENDEYVLEFTRIKSRDRDRILKLCIYLQSQNVNRKKNSL